MLTANHRKSSPTSELSSDFSDSSPRRNHPLPPPPPRRDSHHRERSPERYHRSSTRNNKSPPARSQNSHRAKSQTKEKPTNHVRSPKREYSRSPRRKKVPLEHMRSRSHRDSRSPVNLKPHTRIRDRRKSSPSPIYLRSPVSNENSRSPSPHTKRLRHANQDKEYAYRPMGRRSRGGHEKERHEQTIDKRISTEKSNGRSSKSTIRDHSNSPYQRNDRRKYSSQSPLKSSKIQRRDERNTANDSEQHMNSEVESIAKMKATEEALEAKKKEKPSFELSGKLAEETNRVRGVTLLFNEPADACKPDIRWRLYVFKGGEALNEPLYVHRQSCYLFGRERRVADIPTDHPSCSKQHAVIQYRSVEKEQPDGMIEKNVRPYLMDLGSTNETSINGNCVEPHRYYELFEKDTIKFGNSSREYVILHENSAP